MDAKYEAFAKAWEPYVEPDAMRGFYYLMRHSGPVTSVAAADADIVVERDEPATTSSLDSIPGYGRLRGF